MRKSNLILRLIFLITLILLLVLRLIYFNILIFSKDEVDEPIDENVKPIVIGREEVEVDEYIQTLEEIYKENNDTFGYLIIPGTKVEYPVMYTRGEDYYLRKNIYKQYSVAGTLYIDKYNNISPRDDNLIIYGHNMNNGTMFADLLKYKNKMRVLISLDFKIKGVKPTRITKVGSGATIYWGKLYPHKLYIYEFK